MRDALMAGKFLALIDVPSASSFIIWLLVVRGLREQILGVAEVTHRLDGPQLAASSTMLPTHCSCARRLACSRGASALRPI